MSGGRKHVTITLGTCLTSAQSLTSLYDIGDAHFLGRKTLHCLLDKEICKPGITNQRVAD